MTFSIVAFDPPTGDLGVCVATKGLAVGRGAPWARAGVGAIATQGRANTTFGPRGLALLASGTAPDEVVRRLTADDPEPERRQLGIVDAHGRTATFTGSSCSPWRGATHGSNYACQGNSLVGEDTLTALVSGFLESQGDLALRLITAMVAAQAAGGDRRGQQSAALLVVRDKGGYGGWDDRYVDLRVDDHPRAVGELARLLDVWRADRGLSAVRIHESR